MIDSLLPIRRQNITIVAIKPLTDLEIVSAIVISMGNIEAPYISPRSRVEFWSRVTCLGCYLEW